MVEWPNYQNGFAVLGCLGSEGRENLFNFAKIPTFEGGLFIFSWAEQMKN
jgi:hypothetical protein